MSEENKNINAETLEKEADGWFKGERLQQIEKIEEKIWELLKTEGLSIAQARRAVSDTLRKIEKAGKRQIAEATIK